jgi:hypothetical protein
MGWRLTALSTGLGVSIPFPAGLKWILKTGEMLAAFELGVFYLYV